MLDKFLVTMGIKGQDVVLATMDKIQKKKNAVKKPFKVQMQSQITGSQQGKKLPEEKRISDFSKRSKDASDGLDKFRKSTEKATKTQTKEEREREKAFEKTKQGAKQGVAGAGNAAASQDPTRFIKSMPNLVTGAAASIPFIGAVLSAMGNVINTAVDAATGSLATAKSSAKGAYGTYQRNTEANYYGSMLQFAKGEKSKGGGRSGTEYSSTGNYAPQERAQIIASVSSAFGKIKKPLADVLSPMLQSGKYSTGALSRVAGGDWRSTGSDKGFFLQKLADSFGDLPPSIAQKFQASLLKKYGESEIQQATPEEQAARGRNAVWERADETQVLNLDVASSSKKVSDSLIQLNTDLNKIQVQLVSMGASVSGVAVTMAKATEAILQKAGSAMAFIEKHKGKLGMK